MENYIFKPIKNIDCLHRGIFFEIFSEYSIKQLVRNKINEVSWYQAFHFLKNILRSRVNYFPMTASRIIPFCQCGSHRLGTWKFRRRPFLLCSILSSLITSHSCNLLVCNSNQIPRHAAVISKRAFTVVNLILSWSPIFIALYETILSIKSSVDFSDYKFCFWS